MATSFSSKRSAGCQSSRSTDEVDNDGVSLCDGSITTVEKKRKIAKGKSPSILYDDIEERIMDDKGTMPSKQMSIANLISSPLTPVISHDSERVASKTVNDVTITPEQIEDEVETTQEVDKTASSLNIPAVFLTTQAFASPKDFFVFLPEEAAGASRGPTKSIDKTHVVCTLCQVSMGNRAYTLKRHLLRHHRHVFRVGCSVKVDALSSAKIKNQVTKSSVDTEQVVVPVRTSPGSVILDAKSNKMKKSVNDCTQKHHDAFVSWLNSDVIPMKALKSEFFQVYLSLLNPKFKMPQVIIQPQKLQMYHQLESKVDAVLTSADVTRKLHYMKGVYLQGNGSNAQLKTDLITPKPEPREALIEVLRAGICGTDLQMVNNYKTGFQGVLGHEFVGIVRKLGVNYMKDEKMQQFWIGKRVVGEINVPCDTLNCMTCKLENKPRSDKLNREEILRRNHCPNRSCLGIIQKNGAFAEYITLPVANLYKVPDGVVDSHAVFAEPLAAACRILEQQIIKPTDNVVVLGDGKLGLLVVDVLHAYKAANIVILVGKHRETLALAKKLVYTAYTLKSDDTSEMTIVANRLHNEIAPIDVCIECTGSPGGVALALNIVRGGGTVVMKSTCSIKRSTLDVRAMLNNRVRVIGSRCGPIPWALHLLKERKVDVQKYIHGVYPLERAEAALAHAAKSGALKIQIINQVTEELPT
ncbi:alcohol dehydrogenase [Plasmopara halstedii]|uniref:Alcohol dehydrogenase n=1 Tax=Plasmopara halstedii TaxID=4781 RepID=A0A0P1B6U1_PLAHL|nr:alcohol dehydrogenase [Plasmopara halstedii]CEG50194.1 alcohol dehydrogenase [Plasmopara halstedii]|eukprot:XP_024586563.1 alcohol dehydrogenase [Plasmopara halstedii]